MRCRFGCTALARSWARRWRIACSSDVMQNDPLAELLRDADGDRPPPAGPADLANRVRRRARRGRVARGVLAAGLLAVVVGGASFWHRWLPAEDPKTLSLVTSR